ncbi:MAG: DUF1295 domain-containing protein [Deltaproteobacteria bacterium]
MVWFFAPWITYALVLVLHVVLPARRVEGYVKEDGRPLRYRLNGLLVLVVTIVVWTGVCRAGWTTWDALWIHRYVGAAGAATLGLIFTLVVVLKEPPTGKGLLADLFLGRAENPQWLGRRVDAKMYLYLVGAVLLELNVLSFTAHHVITHDAPSRGLLLSAALLSWFVFDYLFFEHVHLYTYDLFAERVGFKLGWGCMAFYPYFYAVGLGTTAHLEPPDFSTVELVLYGAVFFTGWSLARGANMQKYVFKRDPEQKFLGVITPETVSDGERSLLCSGFWGVSRHVNYLGEVLMATGITLALGHPSVPWPWLYPLYYVLLLGTRERDDDKRCAAKYGALWDRYKERVPRRIIPGIY